MKKQSLQEQVSDRDVTIIKLIAHGYNTNEIAEEVSLSSRTLENMIQDLSKRFGCANRTELACLFLSEGIINFKKIKR